MSPMSAPLKSNRLARYFGTLFAGLVAVSAHAETNVFATRFEAVEGYDGAFTLVGQQGWLGEGTGGNGIVTNFIAGEGQQAYIGYFPPMDTSESELFVWRPINFRPLAAGLPVVKFSVLMSIVDSSFGAWDYFQWRVYNLQTNRLFSLDFDNDSWVISYQLDGTNQLVATPLTFTNDQSYLLTVTMDFASNRWSATLDQQLLATNQPLTTVNAELSLGDVDAVWLIANPELPGDNYLLFDNYQLTAESRSPLRPRLQLLGRTGDGQTLLRLTGPSGTRFAIDATTNFTSWTPLKTNVTSDGSFDHIDTSASHSLQRFYRGRWVP